MAQSRQTRQKELIQSELKDFKSFFDTEELFEKVSKKDSKIGKATVYRVVKELKEKNQLKAFTCENKQLYSVHEASHCHFHCQSCGKEFHFVIEDLSGIKKKIPGKMESFSLEVSGTCDNCIKKTN